MNLSRFARIVDRLHAGALALSMVLLTMMVLIVALNVVARYVLSVSLTWSAELARYSMVWSSLLAAAVLVYRNEHLAVDLVERRLNARIRHVLRVAAHGLALTFFAVMFISGTMLVARTVGQSASSIDLLPMSAVYSIVPTSSLLMFLGSAVCLANEINAGGRSE